MNKTFLLLPLLALALALACGGSAPSSNLAPPPAPAPAPPPAPPTETPTLSLSPKAFTCRAGSFVSMPYGLTNASGPVSVSGYTYRATWTDTQTDQYIGGAAAGGTRVVSFRVPDAPGTHTLSVQAVNSPVVTAAVPVQVTIVPADLGQVLQLSPTAARVAAGEQAVFMAKDTSDQGASTLFRMTLVEPDGGTLTKLTRTAYAYQAPDAPGTYHLVLQKVADGTQVTAEVTVVAPAP